jgi:hypothetical protein
MTTRDAIFAQSSRNIKGTPGQYERFGNAVASADFNGDGYDDIAVGIRNDSDIRSYGGSVQVIYGSGNGLVSANNQLINQNSPGILGAVESYDYFGQTLQAGDFDGDGYADIAVGVPGEDIGSPVIRNAGAIQILFGSASGFGSRDQIFSLLNTNLIGNAVAYDYFGSALAADDFNGDGADDLAIGIPYRDVSGKTNAGAVTVIYGKRGSGLSYSDQFFSQDTGGVIGGSETRDYFGYALAAGDFNNDGNADLAIGVPYEDLSGNSVANAGAVNVLFGSSGGLTTIGDKFMGRGGEMGANQYFGYALTTGDFGGDGYDDLIVGAPWGDDLFSVGTVVTRMAMDMTICSLAYPTETSMPAPLRTPVKRQSFTAGSLSAVPNRRSCARRNSWPPDRR